jgi:hypothetical protein
VGRKTKFKKGTYRVVHNGVYAMFDKLDLSVEERLIFLYVETAPASNYTGLYYLSPCDISRATRIPRKIVDATMVSLSGRGLIVHDADRQLIFVHGMMARQNSSFADTEDNRTGIMYHVERMPEDSPAVDAFIEAQREVPDLYELLEAYGGAYTPPPRHPPEQRVTMYGVRGTKYEERRTIYRRASSRRKAPRRRRVFNLLLQVPRPHPTARSTARLSAPLPRQHRDPRPRRRGR